jgi:hypothetical protein
MSGVDYAKENFELKRELIALESWRGVFGLFVVVLSAPYQV